MSTYALNFTGADHQYGTAVDTGMPSGNAAWTIAQWYRGAGGFSIFAQYGTNTAGQNFTFGFVNNGNLYFSNGSFDFYDSAVTNDNEWHLGMFTFNGSTLLCFRDTPKRARRTRESTTLNTVLNGTFTVGKSFSGAYNDDDVDDLLIYDHALDLGERMAIWNGGSGTDTPSTSGLKRRYAMEEGSGSTLNDTGSGARHITLAGTSLPTWVTPGHGTNPVVRVRPGSLQVGPSRKTFWAEFEKISDASNAVVADHFGGASIMVDGTPIALDRPTLFSGYSYYLEWSLIPPEVRAAIDEDDDECTLNGTWTPVTDTAYHRSVGDVYNTSGSPFTGTAVYHFTGLVAGTYALYGTLRPGAGGRTTDATYAVHDGVTTVATIHQDQTLTPRYSFPVNRYRCTQLGTFTIPGTVATITLANAAGSGTLVADGLFLIQSIEAPVDVDSVVTFSAPQGWMVSDSGIIGASTDLPVTVMTDEDWFEVDLTPGPDRMRTGYNQEVPTQSNQMAFYANMGILANIWQVASGSMTVDPNTGELATVGAGSSIYRQIRTGGGDSCGDEWGLKTLIPGTWVFKYTANDPAAVVTIRTSESVTPLAINYVADEGGKKVFTCDIQHYGSTYVNYFYLYTTGRITGLEYYGPETPQVARGDPSTWTSPINPIFLEQFKDKGLETFRIMNALLINGTRRCSFTDMPAEIGDAGNRATMGWDGRKRSFTVASVEPVALTGPDVDRVQGLFDLTTPSFYTLVRVRTTTDHELGDGPVIALNQADVSLSPGITGTFALAGGGTCQFYGDSICFVTGPRTFTARAITDDGPTPAATTLAGTTTGPWLVEYRLDDNLPPMSDHVAACNECNVDMHLCIPHCFSDDGCTDLFDYLATALDPGRKLWVELSNEVGWNNSPSFQQGNYFIALSRELGHASAEGTYGYALRASQVHAIGIDRFTAADRADDFKCIYGGHFGGTNVSGQVAAFIADQPNPKPPCDMIVTAPYFSLDSSPFVGFSPDCDIGAAYDSHDIEGLVDLLRLNIKYALYAQASSGDVTNAIACGGVLGAYEGGESANMCWSASPDLVAMRGQQVTRHPRWYRARLAFFQSLEDAGFKRFTRFSNFINSTGAEAKSYAGYYVDSPIWSEFSYYGQLAGKADGAGGTTTNSNPWDQSDDPDTRCDCVMAAAMNTWSSLYQAGSNTPSLPSQRIAFKVGNQRLRLRAS